MSLCIYVNNIRSWPQIFMNLPLTFVTVNLNNDFSFYTRYSAYGNTRSSRSKAENRSRCLSHISTSLTSTYERISAYTWYEWRNIPRDFPTPVCRNNFVLTSCLRISIPSFLHPSIENKKAIPIETMDGLVRPRKLEWKRINVSAVQQRHGNFNDVLISSKFVSSFVVDPPVNVGYSVHNSVYSIFFRSRCFYHYCHYYYYYYQVHQDKEGLNKEFLSNEILSYFVPSLIASSKAR